MSLWKDTVVEPFAIVKPRRGFLATPILITINIALWLIMVICGVDALDPDADSLLAWGGNLDIRLMEGEVWRLLTAVFIHSGILHLLLNMLVLTMVGLELERRIGSILLSATFIVTGVGASVCSALMNDGVVSVGASGAIFGLIGTFISLLLLNAFPKKTKSNLLWVILGFVATTFFDFADQGVDHWAHFGGLLGGLIGGFLLAFGIKPMQPAPKNVEEPAPQEQKEVPQEQPTPDVLTGQTEEELADQSLETPDPSEEIPTESTPEENTEALIAPVPDLPIPEDILPTEPDAPRT